MFRAIGFIGTGNMGSALARAADKGAAPGARLYLSNRTPAKAEALCNQLSRAQMSDNQEIARSCDTIFLGVKPQMMAAALEDLVPVLAARTDRFVVVSMAAGLTFETLTSLLGGSYPPVSYTHLDVYKRQSYRSWLPHIFLIRTIQRIRGGNVDKRDQIGRALRRGVALGLSLIHISALFRLGRYDDPVFLE